MENDIDVHASSEMDIDREGSISLSVALMITRFSCREIMLVQHRDGTWSPPAGHVDFTSKMPVDMESLGEAALREFEEETGLPETTAGYRRP